MKKYEVNNYDYKRKKAFDVTLSHEQFVTLQNAKDELYNIINMMDECKCRFARCAGSNPSLSSDPQYKYSFIKIYEIIHNLDELSRIIEFYN